MSHYVVMVNEAEFLRLQELQQTLPEGAEPVCLDAWAPCESCGEDCEYGVPVRLDGPQVHNHSHGIVHPECAGDDTQE